MLFSSWILTNTAAVAAGFVLDWIVGDPAWFPHPVRAIGLLIAALERFIRRRSQTSRQLRTGAVLLTAAVVVMTAGAVWGVLRVLGLLGPGWAFAGRALLSWTALAGRSLAAEAGAVAGALGESLDRGRSRVARIVGRDTGSLGREDVVRATVETVAENTADGIVSPLFWMLLGGPALGYAFKAVSTLDSMVGYLDDTYRDIGWASARLDDAMNYIPARLTGLLMTAAAGLTGLDRRGARRVLRRDHSRHPSPNCGWPEAAAAGALGLRLGGTHRYFGREVVKPTLGDDSREARTGDIRSAIRLMTATAILAMMLLAGAALLVWEVSGL